MSICSAATTAIPKAAKSRDFVSVEDVVKVNLFFLDNPEKSGIFNLGTGRSQPFNDLAAATVNACRTAEGKDRLPLESLVKHGLIRYTEFPDSAQRQIPKLHPSRHHPPARRGL